MQLLTSNGNKKTRINSKAKLIRMGSSK